MDISNDPFFPSYEKAEEAYRKWKDKDPFSQIAPALLNSADIEDYVRLTGMIYPFHKEDLRGATYTVRLKGLCIYYDEKIDGNGVEEYVFCVGEDNEDLPDATKNKENKYRIERELRLKPNSITFITLEPVFQVPDYLALRFNLKIPHVYKGLLLGTGPIIDPGFQGRLSIPLHNLTSNEYVLHKNDEIISLEVTKMSKYSGWGSNKGSRNGEYKETQIKQHRQVTDYLQKALGENNTSGVISSVIGATNAAKKTAKEANTIAQEAKDLSNKLKGGIVKAGIVATVVGVITVLVAVFSLLLPTLQLVQSVNDTQTQYEVRIQELEEQLTELERIVKMKVR